MKKIIFASAILAFSLNVSAQKATNNDSKTEVVDKMKDEKYVTTMKGLITKLNASNSEEAYLACSNGFERIADMESSEWLPKYYIAYAKIMSAFVAKEPKENDTKLEEADNIIKQIQNLTTNSEISCLQGMSYQARIMVDPMSRGAQFGPKAAESFAVANEIDPTNPRPDFLKGQSAFYTPEAFGGGKKVAKKLFESAIQKFDKFKSENELSPNWGKEAAKAMLAKCDETKK